MTLPYANQAPKDNFFDTIMCRFADIDIHDTWTFSSLCEKFQ